MTADAGLGPWRWVRTAALLITVAVALGHAAGGLPLGLLLQIDHQLADAQTRAMMPRTLDPRIVIVDVDERSLAEFGRWPWSRDRLAALTEEIMAHQQAAVLGMDLVFTEADQSSGLPTLERLARQSPELAAAVAQVRDELDFDARFANALKDRPLALGYYLTQGGDRPRSGQLPRPVFEMSTLGSQPIHLTHWDGYAASLPALARVAPLAGFVNNVPDPDGVVRSVPLLAEIDHGCYEALALAIFRAYTGAPDVVPVWPSARITLRGVPCDESQSFVSYCFRPSLSMILCCPSWFLVYVNLM